MASFNSPETLLAITSYPNPKDGTVGNKQFNAVGWHSQKTLSQLAKRSKVVVLAENRSGKQTFQPEKNILVKRVWKKGSVLSILSLAKTIFKLNNIRSIYAQFEFNVFGGILPNIALLAVLLLLRLTGRKITFELHQVITDIALLQKHVNITNPLIQHFFNLSLKAFYIILGLVVNNIIVFEEELKTRLSQFVKREKIIVLSLAVEKKSLPTKKFARKQTQLADNEFVLLVFGFINGYKGIDWIISALKDVKPTQKNRLVIAGGENPYLKDQAHYQGFYNKIVTEAKKYKHITLTGFVPDEEIGSYFAAADLVVMPYEVFMSASGPFSLALSYGKPIIMSRVLSDYSRSEDFSQAMKESLITKNNLFFSFTSKSLENLIHLYQHNTEAYSRLELFTTRLAKLRSSEVVTEKLYTLLQPSPSVPHVLGEEKILSIG